MTLNASQLPLALTYRESVLASALPLALGKLVDDVVISASSLPLPLTRKNNHSSSELPLPLGIVVDDGGNGNGNGGEEEPPRPTLSTFALCHTFNTSVAYKVAICKTFANSRSQTITSDYIVVSSKAIALGNCHAIKTMGVVPINHCYHVNFSKVTILSMCRQLHTSKLKAINTCTDIVVSHTVSLSICNKIEIQQAVNLANCHTANTHSRSIAHCTTVETKYVNIAKYHQVDVQPAIPVPCRFYRIEIPEPPQPDHSACRLRPSSSRLPLSMTKRQIKIPSSVLPLPMICWHDEPTATIPTLRTYIVHNVITADIGGIAVNVLSFDIKSDMAGYCWQGNVNITPRDYAKVKHLLDVPKHQKPLITVVINGESFTIIAENRSESERFAYTSHNISGRSVSARLSADLTLAQTNILDMDNYAGQIVNEQLNNTGISVDEWLINDWRIPANNYSAGGKTPIVVIDDIAKACGGFIDSHPYLPIITIKPHWKVPTWELTTANPDVVIPASILYEVNKSERTSPRYNTVRIIGTEDAEVNRRLQAKDMEAPSERSGLYSDRDCIVSKGIQILSDSGDHGEHTFKIRWAKKYNINLAKKGDIWQVNHPKGAYRCVVTGVAVSVKRDAKGVPKVWQFVTVDRYLDV